MPGEARSVFERSGHLAVSALLGLVFVTGGGAADRGWGDVAAQLCALPLLGWSLWQLASPRAHRGRWTWWGLGLALLAVAMLAMQQLQLPAVLWQVSAARVALAADLQMAGVDAGHAWSLTPLASERGLWSILPALAVFAGTLAMPAHRHRFVLLVFVALATASLMLGYLQLGAPQDSLLNPFPQWAPALNGVFSNQHHQSAAMAIALLVVMAMLLEEWHGERAEPMPRPQRHLLVAAGLFLLVSLPLSGSRAVFLLAALGIVAVFAMMRRPVRDRSPRTWRAAMGLVLRALLAVGVMAAIVQWVQYDIAEEVRWTVARATLAMGAAFVPLGAGLGSFVPWFDQNAPVALVGWEYFNHAHNEYAQWWLESGVPGITLAAVAWVFLVAGRPRRLRAHSLDQAVLVAAWLGATLLLLYSVVDYPLRTPALMTLGAGLLAMVIAARDRPRSQNLPTTTAAVHR